MFFKNLIDYFFLLFIYYFLFFRLTKNKNLKFNKVCKFVQKKSLNTQTLKKTATITRNT